MADSEKDLGNRLVAVEIASTLQDQQIEMLARGGSNVAQALIALSKRVSALEAELAATQGRGESNPPDGIVH